MNNLQVNNLTVSFDGRRVVDGVSFTLERGRTLGIVGESGSGKSVTSLSLMGLLPHNASVSGSAKLGDNELLTLDEEGFRAVRGKRIAMIFQEPMTSLNPVQRCGRQVVEMLRLHEDVSHEEARQRTLELFKEVMLPRPEKIFDSYPHEISGGQKQRVMIAMALICHPDIVIADEPTTALDVTVQKTILDLLRQLQHKHDISIIFISHDLGVIAQIADDIAVMYHGKIVEQGTAASVLHTPSHPYTRGLLACRPPIDSRPRRLPTVADFLDGKNDIQELSGQKESQENSSNPENQKKKEETPLLSVKGLDVTFDLEKNFFGRPRKQLKAVDGISFDVYRGETLGLVGESGCGKTTLGRSILRLIDSASGSITYDGQRLDQLSPSRMRQLRPRLQIIFQDPYSSLNPRMTVGQAIMEPLQVYKSAMGIAASEIKPKVLKLMERSAFRPTVSTVIPTSSRADNGNASASPAP